MPLPILLLASNSPRRRQLLGLTGWTFTVKPAEVDETPQPGEHPGAYVTRLAADKARAAGSLASPGTLVIGADTTVADGNLILGKPADAAEARDMLSRLRGRVHYVYTALAIYEVETGRLETDLCVTRVPMRDYSDLEIEAVRCHRRPAGQSRRVCHPASRFSPGGWLARLLCLRGGPAALPFAAQLA